ncbi:MAG TPA: transglutaminase-like domain-containing protein [Thermomicrobiales bacterium]|nr:transglutaminase-like domain-containing protein [Thermomicrobiales bacterium]
MSQPVISLLEFAAGGADEAPAFAWSVPEEPYLAGLRAEYRLDRVVAGAESDFDAVRAVKAWTRARWEHDGDNEPRRSDPLAILREAEQGKRFRCVEYAIVLGGALTALGIPARVVGLKMADCATRERGAGHVVAEAFLRDRQRWVVVDGQWDAIPTLDGQPLNAVEFQRALALATPGLGVAGFSRDQAEDYFAWIAPYLFYFDVALDNRFGDDRPGYGRDARLMLVPVGAAAPRVFQRRWPLDDFVYTNSLRAFYPCPA